MPTFMPFWTANNVFILYSFAALQCKYHTFIDAIKTRKEILQNKLTK